MAPFITLDAEKRRGHFFLSFFLDAIEYKMNGKCDKSHPGHESRAMTELLKAWKYFSILHSFCCKTYASIISNSSALWCRKRY